MPKNPDGEVNLNSWYPTRAWSISIAASPIKIAGVTIIEEVAEIVSEWATERRKAGSCFLAGQVSAVTVARPGGSVPAIQINGEINPEHATYCSDASAHRLLYRLTKILMETLNTNRAWIRYDGRSMAVSIDWLCDYFEKNPSPTPASA